MTERDPKADGPPLTLKDVVTRLWLEALNSIAEYGSLVVFSALAVAVEVLRRKAHLEPAMDAIIVVAEIVSALTMIVPKAVRAVAEIVHHIAVAGHDMKHVIATGRRRPDPTAAEE